MQIVLCKRPSTASTICTENVAVVRYTFKTPYISRRTAAGKLIALCAPTYNRGVIQHVVFNHFGLAQPDNCSWQAATCHANSAVQAASNSIYNMYRGRNCCTTQHVPKATNMFSGRDCIFLVEQPQNESQLIDILDSLLAASACSPRSHHRCNAVTLLLLLMMMINTFSVLSLQLKKLR